MNLREVLRELAAQYRLDRSVAGKVARGIPEQLAAAPVFRCPFLGEWRYVFGEGLESARIGVCPRGEVTKPPGLVFC